MQKFFFHLKSKIAGRGWRIKFFKFLDMLLFQHIHLKSTYVFYDRINEAGDNAEALFKYLNQNSPKSGRFYFVLDKKSCDYLRLKLLGNVIQPMSLKHWFLHCCCRLIVTSHSDIKFFEKEKEVAFLQHGVILNDLSRIYNAKKMPLLYFFSSTSKEYQSLLGNSYGYGKDVVKLTGLPRWDFLENQPQKIITIAFTWRNYIIDNDNLFETRYFKILHKILAKSDIYDLADLYGYKIQVKLHPMIQKYADFLLCHHDKRLKILSSQIKYSRIISESALLITDYSSITFDFAYLKKPMIYYQEDFDDFYSGSHTVDRGYFDFERDGFGEIVKNKDVLLRVLEGYLKNNCSISDFYKTRIENTYPYIDKSNCERVWNIISKKN